MDAALLARIDRVITATRANVEPSAREGLAGYVALVEKYNAKMDLTAAKPGDEMVDLLLADALVLASKISPGARVVDVGSGCGAPGLPLAIAAPTIAMTLVEPMQKRVSFLRTAIGSLGLAKRGIVVERATGEAILARGDRFDVAVSRATLKPEAWIELGCALAPVAWALFAKEPPPESKRRILDDARYAWPLGGAERRAIAFEGASSDARPSAK